MRVIAGLAKGHNLKTPPGLNTRPTSDKVKGSLFSMLCGRCVGESVIDLFAGSGALGIEALSRGAKSCVFLDKDKNSIACIKDNLNHTKFSDKARVLMEDSIRFLETCNETFDIIFLDPPYHHGLQEKAIDIILNRGLLSKDGIVTVESDEGELTLPEYDGFECIKDKKYGRISLKIYKNSIDYL